VRQLRRYALTGERFGAEEAFRIGLAHKVVPLAELEAEGARMAEHVLANGPNAVGETKAWILRSAWSDLDEQEFTALVESHSAKRQSGEAAEGLASFAEKRAGTGRPNRPHPEARAQRASKARSLGAILRDAPTAAPQG